ncbi:TPM domain-containing protein [Aureibaculum marinum]|uniref:TPM domain-containing protein n=1 Tax=Aureibaculum marinum TaxID=2487930 RepID=A0A3N4N9Q6_9FLAO|nr:TPM domain-containing protein [Aureibaculum marinum]RPD91788.1 TPM domain-containing protein [Aureibaculum marinum]
MKKIILVALVISICSCKVKTPVTTTETKTTLQSEIIPHEDNSFSFISDFSKVFTDNQKASLNLKLAKFEQKTTNEIAIFTLDSIVGDVVSNATYLANQIGVGKKDKDNGLLILLVKPMKKVSIATGKGTMLILTDSICKTIIDKQMIPEFKNENYYTGINNAVDEIIKRWSYE